ncbi:MAG: inorganic phosphate transporter [Saprospiraceae bacterium]|nr:inorganic phosphate transporter [Saprospiraceae bacterium]
MEIFLIVSIVVLACLAIADLIVGVGNDAVNFLNSAIGSKVASFKTIMWVASAGILLGALSSAGMMEIAREGIFNPEYFSLEDVLIIFLAVMLTDIFLLDAFNTLGLPTSTTVSIIFELLGASIIIAGVNILEDNLPLKYLFNINDPANGIIGLINWNKTSTIIYSIFLSVILAFGFGVIVMWISRFIFSFQYEKRLKIFGIIWASLAMLALSYFLIYKGLKSTYAYENLTKTELQTYIKSVNPDSDYIISNEQTVTIKNIDGENLIFTKVIKKDTTEPLYETFFGNKKIEKAVNYAKENIGILLFIFFVFWFLLFTILYRFGYNPLKLVVFAGTFGLAMAFAGNDLVNFIGVPLAGYQSYELFSSANSISHLSLSPEIYTMSGLKFPIKTPYIYLILSGIIMILTLWFSKKSRTVTETEVNLGTQDETDEKFNSNQLSRVIVKGSVLLVEKLRHFIPQSVQQKINNQFSPLDSSNDVDAPAFDLVRASVNLTIASMLIALGTSLKLPLSTTYVSFMVAMGTSLADRAWGRESATYRIAGVINVIVGWFITAAVAFISAGILALILVQWKLAGLIFLVFCLISFIIYTSHHHKEKENKKNASLHVLNSIDLNTDLALQKTGKKIAESLTKISAAYNLTIEGLQKENEKKITQAYNLHNELDDYYSDIKNNLFKAIKKSNLTEKQTAQLYILSNDLMQDILQSLGFIIKSAQNHVKNVHKPMTPIQSEIILSLEREVNNHFQKIIDSLENKYYEKNKEIKYNKRLIFDNIESALSHQVEGISKNEYGFKNTDMILSILLETKDLVAVSSRFEKLLYRLMKGESPLGNK